MYKNPPDFFILVHNATFLFRKWILVILYRKWHRGKQILFRKGDQVSLASLQLRLDYIKSTKKSEFNKD